MNQLPNSGVSLDETAPDDTTPAISRPRCDHKFIDSNSCARCGQSIEAIRAAQHAELEIWAKAHQNPEDRSLLIELLKRVRIYSLVDENGKRMLGLELDIDNAIAGRPERSARTDARAYSHLPHSQLPQCSMRTPPLTCKREMFGESCIYCHRALERASS